MDIMKKINVVRQGILRGLTKNVGTTRFDVASGTDVRSEIKKILIIRPNHRLGNQLLITPMVQEIISTFPNCEIDLFVKGAVAKIIFQNYPNISRIIQLERKPFKHFLNYVNGWLALKKNRYDLVINLVKNSSSGRLSAQFANSRYKLFTDDNPEVQARHPDYRHMAKYPVYNLRFQLEKLGIRETSVPVPTMDLKLGREELEAGKKILKDIIKNDRPTIGLFTFATGPKCYSTEWWNEFYDRLCIEFPAYNVVEILPVENVSQIDFKAPSFYSKDIREIGSVMANTEIFIGADSGMMHLASASRVTAVGLFAITETEIYAPYNGASLAINTSQSSIDDWFTSLHRILDKNP